MKVLFLIFHGFTEFSGISKKIRAQITALEACGAEVTLCHQEVDADGHSRIYFGNEAIVDYGAGIRSKISKRVNFSGLKRKVLAENFDLIYMRYDFNAGPFVNPLVRSFRRAGVRVMMEIPTYPYDREYDGYGFVLRMRLWQERLFRHNLGRQLYRVVTFSDYDKIFGTKTLKISNGVDFAKVPLRRPSNDDPRVFRLLGVAQIHNWHGFDRVVSGMAEYYAGPHDAEVYFDIVGDGIFTDAEILRNLVTEKGMEKYVTLHGAKSGEELDRFFDPADMGIASLGRHRSGITKLKALKNREYAARGIPFTYSEIDDDFESMPYVLKSPADDSPIDIRGLIAFARGVKMTPAEIRATVDPALSWNVQMCKVLEEAKR